MTCGICKQEEDRYKCPKCGIRYCSLKCYKSPDHLEMDEKKPGEKPGEMAVPALDTSPPSDSSDPLLQKLLSDDKLRAYLKEPVVHYWILVLNEILQEVSLTNEYNREGRLEIANKKLAELRSNGLEYNELFEEFCQYVLELIV